MPLPSYRQGYAHSRQEAKYPEFWGGLVSLYAPRLGPTGPTLFDVVGKQHGALTNMENADDWSPAGYDGHTGGLTLGGTDERIIIPANASHAMTTQVSVLADVTVTSFASSAEAYIFLRGSDAAFNAAGTRWYCYLTATDINLGSKVGNSSFVNALGTVTITAGVRYRVAASYNGGEAAGSRWRFFVNGVEYAQTVGTNGTAFVSDTLSSYIGYGNTNSGTPNVNYSQCTYREIAIYNRALPFSTMRRYTTGTGAGPLDLRTKVPSLFKKRASAFTGSGAVSTQTATTSGSGNVGVNGSGTPSTNAATSSGSGTANGPPVTGSGTPATDVTTVAGSGTAASPDVTGSGTPSTEVATTVGSGTANGPPVTGSGTPSTTAATMAGTGSTIAEGSGALLTQTATDAGTGTATPPAFTATGTPSTQVATLAGTGNRNSAPVVTITSPTASATVYNNIAVTGTASDDGSISLIEWSLDQSSWTTATGTTSWSFTLPTQTAGSKTIYVRATDNTGKTTTTSVAVTVFAFGATVEDENANAGTTLTSNLFSGFGTESTQGFARGFSFDPGDTVDIVGIVGGSQVSFQVFRLGYYGGSLARSIRTFTGTPASQPTPNSDSNTRSQNCKNWTAIGQWVIPDDALPGMYMIKMYRTDSTGQGCNILLCVRETGPRDMVYMTADFTWHLAYTAWGTSNTRASGRSLYGTNDTWGVDAERAARVYYDRPCTVRGASAGTLTRFWRTEMAAIAFLERNGYDVGYVACKDLAGTGGDTLLANFGTMFLAGHNEYWSQEMRDRVQDAVDDGMHLLSLSGNTCYWRVLYDESNGYIECWKESENGSAKIGSGGGDGQSWGTQPTDSTPPTLWTGTWRDNAAAATNDPENGLLGTIFIQNNDGNVDLTLARSRFTNHRPWDNTGVSASGTGTQTFTDLLGFEVDAYKMPSGQGIDSNLVTSINAARPPGLILLSYQSVTTTQLLKDDGDNYGSGTYDYGITLYRTAGNGIVFTTGSMNTSWGLYNFSDGEVGDLTSSSMKQLVVNVLAEMGNQPDSLEGTLTSASASGDTTGPTVSITSHVNNQCIGLGSTTPTISGTASDASGVPAGIEYSINGADWVPIDPTNPASWSFSATLNNNTSNTVSVRAIDDWGNVGTPTTITLYTQPYSGSGTPSSQAATSSGSGVIATTGSGSLVTQIATGSGTGTMVPFVGSGTPATDTATATGAGTVTVPSFSGSGTITTDTATMAGTGAIVQFVGSGAVTTQVATSAGTGSVVSFIGTGTVTTDTATVSGTGNAVSFIGSSTAATQAVTADGTGIVASFGGVGSPSTDAAVAAGTGVLVPFIGTGTPATQTTTGAGTGTVTVPSFSGSGTPTTEIVTIAGTGAQAGFLGNGSLLLQVATVAGSGTSTVPDFAGSGTPATQTTTMSGSGLSEVPGVSGTGAITLETVTGAGTGSIVAFPGSGTISTQVATASGSGTMTPPTLSGSGALTTQAVTVSGTGNQVGFIGAGVPATQVATVTGVGVCNGPPVFGTGAVSLESVLVSGVGGYNVFVGSGALAVEVVTITASGDVTVRPILSFQQLHPMERLYWLNRDSAFPTGCPHVLTGVACVTGGAFVYRGRGQKYLTAQLSAGGVFRAHISQIVWGRTTAKIYGVVRREWSGSCRSST